MFLTFGQILIIFFFIFLCFGDIKGLIKKINRKKGT